MAHIRKVPEGEIPVEDQIPDRDNIIQIHGVHSRVIRLHHELYRALMYGEGPLTRVQRELIAYAVSARNNCHY